MLFKKKAIGKNPVKDYFGDYCEHVGLERKHFDYQSKDGRNTFVQLAYGDLDQSQQRVRLVTGHESEE